MGSGISKNFYPPSATRWRSLASLKRLFSRPEAWGVALFLCLLSLSTSVTVASATTQLNLPPATGCTSPGDSANASVLASLTIPASSGKSTDIFDSSYPIKSVHYAALAFVGTGLLLGLMILVGIGLLISFFINRNKVLPPGAKKSHRARNAYAAVFLILILIGGASFYYIYPYITNNENGGHVAGQLYETWSPAYQITLDPYGVVNNSASTYANGKVTYLGGNFTATTGQLEIVILPNSELNEFLAELRSGDLTGDTGCPAMNNLTVIYNSGPATSGAFSVAIPPVSHDTLYDFLFVNPSNSTSDVATAIIWYGLPG